MQGTHAAFFSAPCRCSVRHRGPLCRVYSDCTVLQWVVAGRDCQRSNAVYMRQVVYTEVRLSLVAAVLLYGPTCGQVYEEGVA